MERIRIFRKLSATPFTHSVLLSLLQAYQNPNEKINQMVQKGEIIRLKRGLYVAGDLYRDKQPSPELIANLLYGPSYISMDYALSYYGLIPERVYEITSITTKAFKLYTTPLGRYSYIKSPKCLYQIGIFSQKSPNDTFFMIASQEKALCDKLLFTKNLAIHSQKALRLYLEEDLRIDLNALQTFDTSIIRQCMQCYYKVKLLELLYHIVTKEQEQIC